MCGYPCHGISSPFPFPTAITEEEESGKFRERSDHRSCTARACVRASELSIIPIYTFRGCEPNGSREKACREKERKDKEKEKEWRTIPRRTVARSRAGRVPGVHAEHS